MRSFSLEENHASRDWHRNGACFQPHYLQSHHAHDLRVAQNLIVCHVAVNSHLIQKNC